MPEVHLSRRALFDIERWGESLAAKYLADLLAGAERLGESPELLELRSGISLRLRFYRVREHVLICDMIGDRIFVLAVRHAVMDLPRRIGELEPQLTYEAELLARQIAARKAPRDDA